MQVSNRAFIRITALYTLFVSVVALALSIPAGEQAITALIGYLLIPWGILCVTLTLIYWGWRQFGPRR